LVILLIFGEDFLTFDNRYLEIMTELKGYFKKNISLVMLREVTKHRAIVFSIQINMKYTGILYSLISYIALTCNA